MVCLKRSIAVVSLTAAAAMSAPAHAAPSHWSGFYAGVTGVYAFTDGAMTNDYYGDASFIYSSARQFSEGMYGVRAGRNVAISDSLILGVEADVALSTRSYATSPSLENGLSTITEDLYDLTHVSTARLRLGLPQGAFMPFVTAGVAAGRFRTGWDSVPRDSFFGRGSKTAIGFTAGAGLDYAAMPNVRLHVEYRYTDFGTTHVTVVENDGFATTFNADLHTHAIVFGASYAFGPRN